jgi:phosphatidylinositol alpha-1,6-mannosyltransferase
VADILFVSKPVEPPWNDGSKTLVRDLATALRRHRAIVLGTRAGDPLPGVRVERILGRSVGHSLSPVDALRVLARLALGGRADVWHFFFQPNPRTSPVARAIARARGPRVVHTVSSAPAPGISPREVLFADRTVVLSVRTEQRLLEAGVPGVVRVPPPVAPLAVPSEAERRAARRELALPLDAPLLVFPGDLERGEGARLAIDALEALPEAFLALAYRSKSSETAAAESALRARAARLGVARRIAWIGETPRIHALLGAADVVLLPSRDLGAKVDLPIVLVEAMWQARPVIVARGSAAEELGEDGAALVADPERDAVVAAVRGALGDRELGARARVAARERHDPIRVASRHEALYDELLG